MIKTEWYKKGVFYQIWPRSFKDGNGDGMGDLYGVISKLDYIKSLGVDGIWFSPLYPSPGVDCGYDISDYMDIDPAYGGMSAFRDLLDQAHSRGLKVIMDLVVNHTSDEHEWFQKSRRRIDPYTDYYIWRPGKKGGKLPNNWDSHFEGKAWQWDDVRGEYYLHLFAIKQPDLNMDNPLVRQEVVRILNFWLEMGVDGFREDVITFISKKEGLPSDRLMPATRGIRFYNNGPHIHEYLQQFRREALDRFDCVTIGEAPLISPEKALDYIGGDQRDLDMMIQFQCMCANCFFIDYYPRPFSLRKLKKSFRTWQETLDGRGWNMLYLENHDHPRVVSRYGSERLRDKSAKALCCAYMFQKGTPFVYQGQELGMTNFKVTGLSDFEDVQTLNQFTWLPKGLRLKLLARASRDHARTPMQWDSGEHAGFSACEPWFHLNENYRRGINVESEESNPCSVLNFYRKAIALRKETDCVLSGVYREYKRRSRSHYVYAMESENESLLVVISFSEKTTRFTLPLAYQFRELTLRLSNYEKEPQGDVLRPYEARVYTVKQQQSSR